MPICNKVYSGDCGNDRDNDVERIVSLCEQHGTDIAPSYGEWVKLGFALVIAPLSCTCHPRWKKRQGEEGTGDVVCQVREERE